MAKGDDENFDCMQVKTETDLTLLTVSADPLGEYNSEFDIYDGRLTSADVTSFQGDITYDVASTDL